MIIRSYNTRIDDVLKIPDLEIYFGDDLQLVTKCHDKYKQASSLSGYSFEMRVSNKSDDSLLYTVNGSVSSNIVTYNFDSSNLPSDGDYKYQLYAEDGTECVYAFGNLKINAIIE